MYDGMEREACVCDHGFERSDLCAEIMMYVGSFGTTLNVMSETTEKYKHKIVRSSCTLADHEERHHVK